MSSLACWAGAAIARADFRGAASMTTEDEKERARKDHRNEYVRKRYAEDPEYRERTRSKSNQKHRERMESEPEFREKHLVRIRVNRWRRDYNIPDMTYEKYLAMLSRQRGACKICRRVKPDETLNLDHRHATGWLRGLLCRTCNTGLGLYQDNPVWLIRAAIYVVISLIQENASRHFRAATAPLRRLGTMCARLVANRTRSSPGG
jgi:recombination endonuclease VII